MLHSPKSWKTFQIIFKVLRLAKNPSGTWVATGKDEALVWYMEYYREAIQEARSRRTRGKKK